MRYRVGWLAAVLLAACAPVPPTSTPSTSAVPPSPTAAAVATEEIDPALLKAMAFRRAVGLRADEVWARAVAANPASIVGLKTYGIPMLPEEAAELERRLGRIDDLLAFGESYAAEFPNGFAGAAIDPAAGHRLVLLYTEHVELHRQRLSGIPEPLRPEVREATWTLAELEAFETRIPISTIVAPGIKVWGAAIDTLANRVIVGFGAADPTRGDELPALFGSTGWLVPDWDGPFEAVDLPLGGLLITVVDEAGEPLVGLPCWYTSLNPAVGIDGGGDTREGGTCRFRNLPMGPYRVDILEADELVDRFLKSVDVEVVGGKTVEVTIVIEDR